MGTLVSRMSRGSPSHTEEAQGHAGDELADQL